MRSNRNITGDNWFSSVKLFDKLEENRLTFVGTMCKNKRDIPPEFLPHRNRCEGSSLFGCTNSTTLASYVKKKTKLL